MKCIITKFEGVLHPVGAEAINAFDKLKTGKDYMANITMPRNIQNHRRYFSLVNALFDMQEKYDNVDVFRKMLQIAAGRFDMVTSPDGKRTFLLPQSIAFDKMQEDEFKAMYNHILDVAISKFGINRDAIMRIMSYA